MRSGCPDRSLRGEGVSVARGCSDLKASVGAVLLKAAGGDLRGSEESPPPQDQHYQCCKLVQSKEAEGKTFYTFPQVEQVYELLLYHPEQTSHRNLHMATRIWRGSHAAGLRRASGLSTTLRTGNNRWKQTKGFGSMEALWKSARFR